MRRGRTHVVHHLRVRLDLSRATGPFFCATRTCRRYSKSRLPRVHRNATPFRNVFTFLCPTRGRTPGSARSVESASNSDQGSTDGATPRASRRRGCRRRGRAARTLSGDRTRRRSSHRDGRRLTTSVLFLVRGDVVPLCLSPTHTATSCSAVGEPPRTSSRRAESARASRFPPRRARTEGPLEDHAMTFPFSASIAQPSSRHSAVPRGAFSSMTTPAARGGSHVLALGGAARRSRARCSPR